MSNYFAALPARVPPEMLDSLRAHAPSALRWFHNDDLHLTLAFFGREDPSRLAALKEILARIPFRGCEVTLGRLLLLPRPNRFTSLSFGLCEGRDEIAELMATWRGPLLEAAGRPPDIRFPRPHLTIARPARKHPAFSSRQIVRWAKALEVRTTPVAINAPVLYGWSADRPARQFRVIEL